MFCTFLRRLQIAATESLKPELETVRGSVLNKVRIRSLAKKKQNRKYFLPHASQRSCHSRPVCYWSFTTSWSSNQRELTPPTTSPWLQLWGAAIGWEDPVSCPMVGWAPLICWCLSDVTVLLRWMFFVYVLCSRSSFRENWITFVRSHWECNRYIGPHQNFIKP